MVEKRQGILLAFTKSKGKNNEFSQLQKKKKKKWKDSLSFMQFTPKCPQKHNHYNSLA